MCYDVLSAGMFAGAAASTRLERDRERERDIFVAYELLIPACCSLSFLSFHFISFHILFSSG